MQKRLVLFVEGKGDVDALPALAARVINEIGAHDTLFVDSKSFRNGGLPTLAKNNFAEWHRLLSALHRTRINLGAVLLVLDGDADDFTRKWQPYINKFRSNEFCPFNIGAMLGEEARTVRAGDQYSLASVFAMKEFESWLLAGLESLRGKSLTGGRGIVPNNAVCPEGDPENIRGAKERLSDLVPNYSPTLDQATLAKAIDLETVRNRCRSFRRFCSAIQQLTDSVRGGRHVITPLVKII